MQKRNASKIILSVLFLVGISVWLIVSIVGGAIRRATYVPRQWWDGTKDYPIQQEQSMDQASKKKNDSIEKAKDTVEENLMDKHLFFIKDVLTTKYIDKYFYHYNATTSAKTTSNNAVDPMDVIVNLETGQLSYVVDDSDYDSHLNEVIEFEQYTKKQGIPFVMFYTPLKNGKADTGYKDVYNDYSNEKRNEIITGLRGAGIEVIDYAEVAKTAGEDILYFNTDHHWLPQMGLSACKELGRYLNTNGFDVDIDIFNEENYQIEYGEVSMLGSQGRKVTEVYADYEQLPVIHPLYESDLTVFNSEFSTTTQGTIEETLYDYSQLEEKDPYEVNQYALYGYGDVALLQIHNNMKADGKRILVIKESFADCMTPFMSNMSEDLDVIDLRDYRGSLKGYIEANKPDMIVMIYGTTPFLDSSQKNDHASPFDFR